MQVAGAPQVPLHLALLVLVQVRPALVERPAGSLRFSSARRVHVQQQQLGEELAVLHHGAGHQQDVHGVARRHLHLDRVPPAAPPSSLLL